MVGHPRRRRRNEQRRGAKAGLKCHAGADVEAGIITRRTLQLNWVGQRYFSEGPMSHQLPQHRLWLEEHRLGCPVIASNISSLPEAGGDAALYVDPLSVQDIKKNLEKMITDSKLREQLIKKGYEQIEKFSWEKTAKETLKALETIKE